MNQKLYLIAGAFFILAGCKATDTKNYYSISDALNSPQAKDVLNPNIKLEFVTGGGKTISKGLISNKKTNAFNKTDVEACNWAFLSAVKQFQDTATQLGGTRVTHLISYYKKVPFKSKKMFECHTGNIIAGVALHGDIAK